MALAALVDAGPLVAVFGENQPQGGRYRALFKQAADEQWSLATTWPCVVEASYLLDVPQRYTLLRWVAVVGISVFPFAQESLESMVELMRKYTETPPTEMDMADASLVWLATDTGVTRIMTLDLRDFSRYRLPDGRAFEIL
jgi:predicted nucleic acid-binding protein